jgi:uncharacterized protein YebE (UPF0316 family)
VSAPSGVLAGDGLASGVVMAAMALASVGLWTLRVAFAARGRKLLGAAVAALEAVVFAVAFSSLSASLDAPVPVVGYACGVAVGTVLGLYVDERASRGKSEIQVVVHDDDRGLLERLRSQGWPATSFPAQGPQGSVTVAFLAVDDAQVPQVVDALQQSVPEAFWAVQQLRRLHPSLPSRALTPVAALAPPASVRRRPHRPTRLNPTRTRENSHDHHHSLVLAARDHTA